ncbi:hypothetical protein D3C75_449790 [compost metagenome]
MRRHQFGFGIQTCPAVRQGQANNRLNMKTGGFWLIITHVGEMNGLAINAGIKRPNIVLIVIHIQLRLRAV